jgi:amidase
MVAQNFILTLPDDVNLVSGMPVGLQIVGGRFGEEKTVAVAKVIQELLLKRSKSRK